MKGIRLLIVGILVMMVTSCYYRHPDYSDSWDITEHQQDSLLFAIRHHYTCNYNFSVVSDSIVLRGEHPLIVSEDAIQDSIWVYKNSTLVVADITTIPEDSIDSVWVKVAESQEVMGWIHEEELLSQVVPDTPISKFIYLFSHMHVVLLLSIPTLLLTVYMIPTSRKKHRPFIHINDIESFYPTLFCLLVAVCATLYGTLQGFAPETWIEYYFHPTLNPLQLPPILCAFVCSIWFIILMGIALIDEVRRQLPPLQAIHYLVSVLCMSVVCYLVFTLLTLYYIGYPILAFYAIWTIARYFKQGRAHYTCGNCGRELRHKGECPYCHAVNE